MVQEKGIQNIGLLDMLDDLEAGRVSRNDFEGRVEVLNEGKR